MTFHLLSNHLYQVLSVLSQIRPFPFFSSSTCPEPSCQVSHLDCCRHLSLPAGLSVSTLTVLQSLFHTAADVFFSEWRQIWLCLPKLASHCSYREDQNPSKALHDLPVPASRILKHFPLSELQPHWLCVRASVTPAPFKLQDFKHAAFSVWTLSPSPIFPCLVNS